MSTASPVILIVEDDESLGLALQSFLKKKALESVVVSSAESARRALSEHRIQVMIVDCLLPGESGVDFVESIRSTHPAAVLEVVLMSGIFVEPQFIKESLRATQASAFLKKPFALDELSPFIAKVEATAEASSPRRSLYQAFGNTGLSPRDKRKIIESLEDIHGFDLPFIYSFLLHAKIPGHLNIVDDTGQVFGVKFSDGVIVGVDLVDSESVIGKLLIESGFILPDDLESALAQKSSKRIGERLIDSHLLSPHGFEIVLANQMSIRMSRTVVDRSVRVNFVGSDVPMSSPSVEGDLLERFIHDWVASRLTSVWLKAHFTPYGNFVVLKGPEFRLEHSAFRTPLVAKLERLVDVLLTGATINDILEKNIYAEEDLLKALHFMMCTGILIVRERPRVRSLDDQKKHLKNIHTQLSGKNSVEAYNLMVRMTTASERSPDEVLQQFLEMLGPSPTSAQREHLAIFDEIVRVVRAAHSAVKSGAHSKIKDEIIRDEVEKKLKASQFFDQARVLLEKSQYAQALSALEKVEGLDPQYNKLRLHLVWARLGSLDAAPNKSVGFKAVDNDLLRVDPEDKFDALYSFINGLYAKAKGDYPAAKRAFDKAVAMDSTLISARRELAVIASLSRPKQDVFNQDLKTLVGSLFKKR